MNKKKVVLGMSGGTDSSMTAILLQEAGYEVIGVTFVFFGDGGKHLEDARELAQKLGIKHITHHAQKAFKTQIIDYFTAEYFSGKTPVPCIICNNQMKWPLLIEIANQEQAYYVATGHYIQTQRAGEKIYITPGLDPDKDQSFFMWGLRPELLERMMLPLGTYTKEQVRQMAAARGFQRVSQKKDSLGVCFCQGDYRDFLKQFEQSKHTPSGYFKDTQGKILGHHQGYPYYTVGQRRGLGINLNQALYVKEILPKENEVILATHQELYQEHIQLKDVNINYPEDLKHKTVICRIRYRKQNTPCRVSLLENNQASVKLLEPLDAIAPGQAAAFYDGNRIIGGGIIL